MPKIYGYCRTLNPKQSMEKQKQSILAAFPDAVLIEEDNAGSNNDPGKCFADLLEKIKSGDMIIFDSISRLSRNAQEGSELYLELYHAGVDLVFLKQRQIDTAVYRKVITNQMAAVQAGAGSEDQLMNEKLNLLKEITDALAREQIEVSFLQAEKEAAAQRQKTREGLMYARTSGKQIGLSKGSTVTTKKERDAVPLIRKLNQHFGGSLNDQETAKEIGISRQTVAKYISRMLAEDQDPDGSK